MIIRHSCVLLYHAHKDTWLDNYGHNAQCCWEKTHVLKTCLFSNDVLFVGISCDCLWCYLDLRDVQLEWPLLKELWIRGTNMVFCVLQILALFFIIVGGISFHNVKEVRQCHCFWMYLWLMIYIWSNKDASCLHNSQTWIWLYSSTSNDALMIFECLWITWTPCVVSHIIFGENISCLVLFKRYSRPL